MNSWLLWLPAAILFPPLGRILLDAALRRRESGLARLLWTLASIYLWCRAAWLLSAREEGRADTGAVFLLVVAGLLYLEMVALWGWRGRRPAGAADRPVTAGEEEPAPPESPEAEALLRRMQALERIPCEAIMTPRERIIWVDAAAPAGEALLKMRQAGHTRLPVVSGGSLDRVEGVAHAKDLLPQVLEAGTESPVRRHVRRALRVARATPAAQLLEEFRRKRVHVAMVGDALGRTLGLVTLGDVFRVLTGPGAEPPEPPGRERSS
jgi:CBS domain-containing protein